MRILEEAQLRHSRFYMGILCRCEKLYLQDYNNPSQSVELLDKEWRNIKLAVAWCEGHADGESAATLLCSDYSKEGSHLLRLLLHPQDHLHRAEAAFNASRQLNRPDSQATHLNNIGLAYMDMGQVRLAIKSYKQALTILRKLKDRKKRPSLYSIWALLTRN